MAPSMKAQVASSRSIWRTETAEGPYVADLRSSSLLDLLNEAFAVIEHRFAVCDRDGAGMLIYRALEANLALAGFADDEALHEIWNLVDLDANGTLDFGEFLCLVFLWKTVGDYDNFFIRQENIEVVSNALAEMKAIFHEYDRGNKLRLSPTELSALIRENLPELEDEALDVIDRLFPPKEREQGNNLSFPRFMHLMYCCCAESRSTRIPGNYKRLAFLLPPSFDESPGVGPDNVTWKEFHAAFEVLEMDFNALDADGNGIIDYSELTMGVPQRHGEERLSILARLQYKFNKVDLDKSRGVDFFEFMYLGFLMTQDGSYSDLTDNSANHALVKKAFINIHRFYVKYDEDRNLRLTEDELFNFFRSEFGMVPSNLGETVKPLMKHSSAAQGRLAVDLVRFIKLLYYLTFPDGNFRPEKGYHPNKHNAAHPQTLVSIHKSIPREPKKRIQQVFVSEFVRGRLLGEGTQGKVYLGVYHGQKVAGKMLTVKGKDTKQLARELNNEVQLLLMLDHPHCQYLIGAKTTFEDGPPLILTEVCEEGSLFDAYAKRQIRFDEQTALRIAKECALGLDALHELGYMHRDVKSLNIFLAKGYSARVADFGMATAATTATEACGTVQWMAPEVLANFFNPGTSLYNRMCDVYSFGILLWELTHCSCPYADTGMDQMEIAKAVMTDNIRPTRSADNKPMVEELIEGCWHVDPDNRPDFKRCIQVLRQVEKQLGASSSFKAPSFPLPHSTRE